MPVLESTDHITPKSALRHRPIAGDEDRITTLATPTVKRASRTSPQTEDAHVEVDEWQRAAEEKETSSPVRTPLRRAGATNTLKKQPKTPLPKRPKSTAAKSILQRHAHPLFYLGIGMLGMLALWMILTSAISWFNTTMDNLHYGYPRTYQSDAFVGHNESSGIPSHFIALNLHGHLEVIEFPGGDAAHARIFLGPQLYTSGSDLVVVTLKFIDVNADHKPDMIVQFQGSQVVFINDQGTFRPLRPEERHQVEQFLQSLGQ